MFERAAGDPDYAKSRGLDPAAAAELLEAHRLGGSPKVPDRIARPPMPAKRAASINHRPKGFGPRR